MNGEYNVCKLEDKLIVDMNCSYLTNRKRPAYHMTKEML